MSSHEAQVWNESEKLSTLFPRPAEGWFRFIRNSLGLTPSQLAKRIQIKEKLVTQIEEDEINNRLIKKSFMDIAQVLESGFEYIILPRLLLRTDNESKKSYVPQEFLEGLEKLLLLPEKPYEGWICETRRILGLTQEKLGKNSGVFPSVISKIQTAEKEGRLFPQIWKSMAEELNCKIELIFI